MLCQLRPWQEPVNRIIMISKHSSASDKLRKRRTYPRDEFGLCGIEPGDTGAKLRYGERARGQRDNP